MENNFIQLRKLYLSRASIDKLFEHLDKIIKNDYSDANQLLIHSHTIDCETSRNYPLPVSYQLKFLKELIKRLEDSRNLVNESIYSDYIELLNNKSSDEFHYVTYTVCDQEFTFKQSDKMVSEGTTGLRSWEASFQLFEQIFANSKVFNRKKILELGAGSAMTGILISSLLDIDSYTFTDHHEKVIELINSNLKINGLSVTRSSDKKQNKFYQFEDDEGKNVSKYYEDDQLEISECRSKADPFGSFGSNFIRQGPMDLETSRSTLKKIKLFQKHRTKRH